MLRRNLDGEIIRTFVARIADIIRPLDPALVYFRAPDPVTAFRAICDERGMAWTLQHISGFDGSAWARTRGENGMGGVLAYWREHAAICDAVAAGARLRTLIVGPEVGDWPSRRRHIAAFLGLTAPASAAVVVPDLARFVGTYRDGRGRKALLSIHDGDLAVEGLLWQRTRLVPCAPSTFEAESLPFRLTFEDDPTGGVARFHLEGPDLPHIRLACVYEKVNDSGVCPPGWRVIPGSAEVRTARRLGPCASTTGGEQGECGPRSALADSGSSWVRTARGGSLSRQ